jgi:hypothetical protein
MRSEENCRTRPCNYTFVADSFGKAPRLRGSSLTSFSISSGMTDILSGLRILTLSFPRIRTGSSANLQVPRLDSSLDGEEAGIARFRCRHFDICR